MIETPNGDGALCSPEEAERALDIVHHRANTELGTTHEMVVDLLGKHPVWHADEAVPSNTFPTAYYKLECAESCERISEVLFIGDDIL